MLCIFCLISTSGLAEDVSVGDRLDRITGQFEAYVAAAGLESPDGLAIHPLTGELYVSEEAAGRISVIRKGKAVPALARNWEVIDSLPEWAVTDTAPRAHWLSPKLESPEGLAFSKGGLLFVTEDTPRGRLLEFIPDEEGQFSDARAIPIPWLDQPYAWESVVVAEDGRLFLAGSAAEAGPGLFYGTVLIRDDVGNWSVIDYSPFASFSSIALSRDEDILVVGEETFTGSVSWWDTVRRLPINTVTSVLPSVEGVCVLPDGSILAAQESSPPDKGGGGRLLRIDPQTGSSEVMAEGFGMIESVIVSPKTHFVYLTEDSSGLIIELRPKKPFQTEAYLLQRSLRTYEAVEGLAPREWPPFLRQFFTDLGVSTRDEEPIAYTPPGTPPPKKDILSITLQELGMRIPLIAGKLRTSPSPGKKFADPVVAMDFVLFFPNQMLKNGVCTPSLSLFSAKRQSGRVERTQVLSGMNQAVRYKDGTGWIKECDNAQLYLPLTSCSAMRSEYGTDVSLAFLGLGVMQDYYLHILLGGDNRGELVMEDDSGQLASYDVSVTEHDVQGNEHVNVVVTGFGPKYNGEPMWLDIGPRPVWDVVNDPKKQVWVSYWISRRGRELLDLMARNEEEWRTAGEYRQGDDREAGTPRRPPDKAVSEKAPGENKAALDSKEGTPVSSRDKRKETKEQEDRIWTNMLLSRAITLWKEGRF
ncbi:MAG: hypothetical protein V1873_02855 [Verrucomicrobiota bacterium]